jgi:hypothetical protein
MTHNGTHLEVVELELRLRVTIACFLVKIRGASAGWTRAVALLER